MYVAKKKKSRARIGLIYYTTEDLTSVGLTEITIDGLGGKCYFLKSDTIVDGLMDFLDYSHTTIGVVAFYVEDGDGSVSLTIVNRADASPMAAIDFIAQVCYDDDFIDVLAQFMVDILYSVQNYVDSDEGKKMPGYGTVSAAYEEYAALRAIINEEEDECQKVQDPPALPPTS